MYPKWSFLLPFVYIFFALGPDLLHSSSYSDGSLTWYFGCSDDDFHCDNGTRCLQEYSICDSHADCKDGSDEGENCTGCWDESVRCEQYCKNTPLGPKCGCRKGFVLGHDHKSCVFEHGCIDGGPCDHYCHDIRGVYSCSCAPGYTLQGRTSCGLDQYYSGQIYFSVGHEIRNLPLNSWVDLLLHEFPDTGVMCDMRVGAADGLDTNYWNAHYYYTKNGGIYAHNEAEICLVQGLDRYQTNVAVDWITGNLYFLNEVSAQLGVCRSDGRFCRTLIHGYGMISPRGLALLPKLGLMFWTDVDADAAKIERANMDGTERKTIITDQLGWPNAITIDYVHNLLYFGDAKRQVIERSRLDGSHRELIHSNSPHPFDMLVFDNNLYWTDWKLDGVVMARISDKSDHRILYRQEGTHPYGIALFHQAYQQKDFPNPCDDLFCSHMCALTAGINGDVFGSCLCPNGYEFRAGSEKECVPVANATGPHWCVFAFMDACENGHACRNGGRCVIMNNEYGTPVTGSCLCEPGYGGEFCEVEPEVEIQPLNGKNPLLPIAVIISTILLVVLLVAVAICRRRKNKGGRSLFLRWSHAIIFHEKLPMRIGDASQRREDSPV